MALQGIRITRRAQNAIEMLTTYGWAILVIAIALAALFALGVLNPQNIVGTTCVINQAFQCSNVHLSSSGLLFFTLLQDQYQSVNITGIGCSENSSNEHVLAPNALPSTRSYMPGGNETNFTAQCYAASGTFSGSIGSILNATLYINYTYANSQFPYSVTGKVLARVDR